MLRVRAVLSWLVLSLGLAAWFGVTGQRVELLWTLQTHSCCSFVFSRLPLPLSLLQTWDCLWIELALCLEM